MRNEVDETDFEAIADVCSERFAKAIRDKGWLHKDDPIKGLQVKIKCTSSYAPTYPDCKKICQNKGCERPLTNEGKEGVNMTWKNYYKYMTKFYFDNHNWLMCMVYTIKDKQLRREHEHN